MDREATPPKNQCIVTDNLATLSREPTRIFRNRACPCEKWPEEKRGKYATLISVRSFVGPNYACPGP